MNPASIDVKDMLVANTSLGLIFDPSLANNLFVAREPTEPNDCVTIFDTPGRPPQLTLKKGEDYFYPSMQIRVRNKDYLIGWALINDIRESLHARGPEVWNGTRYGLIQCSSGPAMLDWDENKRVRFVVNFNIQRA